MLYYSNLFIQNVLCRRPVRSISRHFVAHRDQGSTNEGLPEKSTGGGLNFKFPFRKHIDMQRNTMWEDKEEEILVRKNADRSITDQYSSPFSL